MLRLKVNIKSYTPLVSENKVREWASLRSCSSSDMDLCDIFTDEWRACRPKTPPPPPYWCCIFLFHILLWTMCSPPKQFHCCGNIPTITTPPLLPPSILARTPPLLQKIDPYLSSTPSSLRNNIIFKVYLTDEIGERCRKVRTWYGSFLSHLELGQKN